MIIKKQIKHVLRMALFYLGASVLFFTRPFPALAQPSIIETLQGLLPSVVNIESENADFVQSSKPAAAIDKNTGRLIVLRNVKSAYYKRVGAGVMIDPQGFIATNYHTIAKANKITVTLHDKTSVAASVIRIFPQNDLAIIRIFPPYPLRAVGFADSDAINLNDTVFSIGHSELLDETLSEGKIIGIGVSRSQKKGTNEEAHLLQVNMNLYRGDSGGPLFDRYGQLAGLIVAGESNADRSSFAIPSNKIKKLYAEYLTTTPGK